MSISKETAEAALAAEIVLWRDLTCNNIQNAVLPAMATDDALIKSAVWLNFGLDLGKNLSLGIATAATRAALPIWMLFKAQELYATHYYKPQTENAHKMLSQHYESFKSTIINNVVNAEREFMAQPFARQVTDCLLSLYRDHPFDLDAQKTTEVRSLIAKSKVIQTDHGVLQQTIKTNLDRVAKNIMALYHGTRRFGRNPRLYVADSRNAYIPANAAPTPASCFGYMMDHQVPKGFSKIDSSDKATMAALYANAHKMEIKHHDFPMIMPCYDTTYVRPLNQPNIQTQLTQSYKGTIQALIETYHREQAGRIAS